jgi:preprotein translocase subunit SecY
MLSAFANSLKIPELRQRIFFTVALIFVCRLISVIPVPGVDAEALRASWTAWRRRAGTSASWGCWTCSAAAP